MSQSKKALDAILNEGISVHEACLRFGISRAAISKEKLHPSAKSILEKQVYVLNEQCVFKDKTIDKLNCETKQLRAELAAAKAEIEKLSVERNKWMDTARIYYQNSEHWLKKFNEVICAPTENNTGSMG